MFPANCALAALAAAACGCSVHTMRNRSGRVHVFWRTRAGQAFEFYRKGASRWPYWRLALYFGEIRRAPALDAASAKEASF